MLRKLVVKTKPGEICPFEDDPRRHITDSEKGTPVADSAYYRRLIADGSLVIVPEPEKKTGGKA